MDEVEDKRGGPVLPYQPAPPPIHRNRSVADAVGGVVALVGGAIFGLITLLVLAAAVLIPRDASDPLAIGELVAGLLCGGSVAVLGIWLGIGLLRGESPRRPGTKARDE